MPMSVYMKGTSRLRTHRAVAGNKQSFLSAQSGDDIARASRVEDLRRLVVAGRFRVQPDQLAERILRRALARRPGES